MATSAVSSGSGMNVADILNQNAAAANSSSNSSGSSGTSDTSQSSTTTDIKGLNDTYNQFLLLLTKQLQNQDPLNPMDTAQFTNQLVQFSSVEQQINQNKRLDQLISLQSSTNTYAAANFLGKDVAVNSDQLSLKDGKASFQYTIENQAAKALLRITDAKGNLVAIQEANSGVGTYQVNWNGTDATGNQLPDGQYQVSVQYEDANGKDYSAPITVYGTVDSADVKDGQVSVNVGSVNYPVDQIEKIVQAPASAPSTPTTPSTSAAAA
ncbi:MAG TPA: flagellar hook assembly protein FlgD [Terriglobales bacterium]|nr:flagellar hook assembly protein FlgD [Terriglobales bacterium]